jgi:DNA-directed RNA polymerase specialized sigma24 family protein
MAEADPEPKAARTGLAADAADFTATRWTLVVHAGNQPDSTEGAAALTWLCERYWYPLYAFARRRGLTAHDAQDATQGFFEHLLEKCALAKADPTRGRFRSFLLTSFRNHLGQQRLKDGALKRGGGCEVVSLDETVAEERYHREPVDRMDPEHLFERRWAVTLIETVLQRLEAEYAAAGKAAPFAVLKPYLTGDQGRAGYAELAAQTGTSEGAARVAVHRFRQRYHDLFRAEVAQTVTSAAELAEELRHICRVLASPGRELGG